MTEGDEKLTPATPQDLADSLAFALRFDGRKRFRTSGEAMARITAEHLVEHLEQSGFVFMKRPYIGARMSLSRGPSKG
jgi:hypothetical protein